MECTGRGPWPPPFPILILSKLCIAAQVGDALAEVDPAPGEAHNYFALLGIRPQDLLRRLVKSKGCVPAASQVAFLLVDWWDEGRWVGGGGTGPPAFQVASVLVDRR